VDDLGNDSNDTRGNMIFITGADHRFDDIVREWVKRVTRWHYKYAVANLGSLSLPEAVSGFEVTDRNYVNKGYFNSRDGKKKSTGLWKWPWIKFMLESQPDDAVYLDADARLCLPLLIDFKMLDVGVVGREIITAAPMSPSMRDALDWQRNAGVMFFSNNEKVRVFVNAVVKEIERQGNDTANDQAIFNQLLGKSDLRVKVFPTNFNTEKLTPKTIIWHKTGGKKYGKTLRQSYR
jgi:hypothetical protein